MRKPYDNDNENEIYKENRAETMHACALGARKSKDGIQQVTLSKF